METTVSTIETVLNNAFVIRRKGTKHCKTFIHNTFERPITHLDFFQLLANSDINLSSFELTKYMCHIKAADYVTNWQGDVKLVVSNHLLVQQLRVLNITISLLIIISLLICLNGFKMSYYLTQTLAHQPTAITITKSNNY